METVTVKKTKLLKTLKANKKTHQNDFEIAWEKYRERAIQNVTEVLDTLKDPKTAHRAELYIHLSRPENHSDDFDRAIGMLDWEIGDEVELQEHEFRQYVQNEWGWSRKFSDDAVFYTGSASPSTLEIGGGSRVKRRKGDPIGNKTSKKTTSKKSSAK